MNILLLGSGGREDALAWRLRQSPSCETLIASPGNPGISRWAECVGIDPCDPEAVTNLAKDRDIGLVVIGPEAPLVAGVADALRSAAIPVFGPNAAAAQLEGSKGFTKDLCAANDIPTAGYVRVETVDEARNALAQFGAPVVIKADGLAAGKGVTLAMSMVEAEAAIDAAGDGPMVIEEFLEGEEASLFALVDGETAISLASAQDHKRVGEGDTGPNTGGMGAYSPAPVLTAELERRAMKEIVLPTARAMASAGTPFSGVLYAGLMLTHDGPKLIEYNVRFGDPECEAIMPLIEGDFAELLLNVATGRLSGVEPRLSPQHAVTVIVAARGYPGTPASGGLIREIEAAEQITGVTVFHAGTAQSDNGLVAKGGRVLAVTAIAETFANARARAYRAVDQIDFADGFYRSDIGWREIQRSEGAMAGE
ncbi:phosphoribosylamine--glycine ligase [Sphingomonas sp. SM33]|uniref:Phosphoribosylamine--glycine ligase n=1 Tax=Sphingomonas telluris TaxID=2907998 RepID=A0ABS9VQ69_9SPHN|nr:phosphoribosylamine--glycine ligase [Sphingomonas telluris]MCH8617092.1 phosphoribosylamine--glycine ligase [Sphingomonas telluris]